MIVSTPLYLWINLKYNVMILKWKCIHVYHIDQHTSIKYKCIRAIEVIDM